MTDYLELKWGTLKGWNLESEAAKAALKALANTGPRSMSAALQKDTDEQQQALLNLIDAVDGPIWSDWDGEKFPTKEAAKQYIINYGKDT